MIWIQLFPCFKILFFFIGYTRCNLFAHFVKNLIISYHKSLIFFISLIESSNLNKDKLWFLPCNQERKRLCRFSSDNLLIWISKTPSQIYDEDEDQILYSSGFTKPQVKWLPLLCPKFLLLAFWFPIKKFDSNTLVSCKSN